MSSTTGSSGDETPGQASMQDQPLRSVGEIAHDLNNVLTSVLGYAEIIAEDARLGNVSVRDAEQLVAATREAVALTKVLRVSRPAAPGATAPAQSEGA